MKSVIALVAILACAYAVDIKECSPSSDKTGCDADECCIPEMEFFKVSKRDMDVPELIKPVFPWGDREGRCVKYWQEGENCYSMARWQECGCASGLRCQYTPHPDEVKRAIPPQFRPKGVHACVVDDQA